MGCSTALQKQAGPGLFSVASNMSSREGGFEIELWAEPVVYPRRHLQKRRSPADTLEQTGGGYGIFKQRLAEKAHLHRHVQDKENVNPSGRLDFRPSSLPSWHQRYPLKDITVLIHSLQGFQVDIDPGLACFGRSELEGQKQCCHVFPASCKDTNKNSAQLLRMR